MSVPFPRCALLRPLAAALALATLVACSSDPAKDVPTLVSIQQYQRTAYVPAEHFTLDGWSSQWKWDKHQLNVALLVPHGQKNVPLIIYLPGLGENETGGDLWRQTWVDAGYAVLSVQAPRYDRSIYRSADAQAGAFRAIAEHAFSDASLKSRVEEVDQMLAEVKRRSAAGEPGYSAVDSQRIVVAGYDLGAQTAAALAGERDPGTARPVAWRPRAVILLSPYVEGGADRNRFSQIDTPVLAVTGLQDEDPFSWVSSAQQRQDLYDNLGPLGGYELLLPDTTHQGLSGTLSSLTKVDKKSSGAPVASAEPADKGDPIVHEAPPPSTVEQPIDVRQATSIAAVTTAWLDATIKQSVPAQQWLQQKAPKWLDQIGMLSHKGANAP